MQFRNFLAVALLLHIPGVVPGQGRGGFDPAEFLKRLDTNGNGQIDPEESEGRAGYFLKRIAENNPDIDLSKPVPLERVERAFAAARERRELEQNDGDRGRNGDRGRSDESNRDRPRSGAQTKNEPLVPGFGVESNFAPVPGFGLLSAATAVIKITDVDRQEAERRFRYYDRNNDGVLDVDEMRQSRSGDYEEYDRNHDGQLTLDELAVRYAKRRVADEREREQASASTGSSSSNSSSSSSSLRSSDGDRSRGGWFGRREGDRDEGNRDFRDSRSRSSSSTARSDSGGVYRIASAEERLAKLGVPSWFRDGDKNGDGQIAMTEFSGTLSESSLAEFAKFDGNGDGLITPGECMQATKSGVSRGGSSSLASSRTGGSFSRSSESSSRSSAIESSSGDFSQEAATSTALAASSPGDDDPEHDEDTVADEEASPAAAKPSAATVIDPQYLNFAEGRIKQLDTNGDGILRPEEWAESAKPIDAADVNGDKLITAGELALFYMKK